MSSTNCYAVMPRPTVWQRLGFGECSAPQMDDEHFPGFSTSRLVSNTYISFGWLDRLRILISGKVMVATSHKTDVIIEKCASANHVSVLPPTYPLVRPK